MFESPATSSRNYKMILSTHTYFSRKKAVNDLSGIKGRQNKGEENKKTTYASLINKLFEMKKR